MFLMFLNARGVHNEEFHNFSLQERLLGCIPIKEDETHHGDKNQSHYRPEVPRGFQEVKVARLRDNGPGWW